MQATPSLGSGDPWDESEVRRQMKTDEALSTTDGDQLAVVPCDTKVKIRHSPKNYKGTGAQLFLI